VSDYPLHDLERALMPVCEAAIAFLESLTNESKVRAALLLAELDEAGTKAEQAEQEEQKAKGATGMMAAPYGYCATCGVMNSSRLPNASTFDGVVGGTLDKCLNGHTNLSVHSLLRPPENDEL